MKYGFPCPPAMVESALRYIEIAESEGYHDIIVSLKSSDVLTAVEAYRLYAKQCRLPDAHRHHRGRQAALRGDQVGRGLAPILLDGIGDTIRISLLGDPVPEIAAAFDILQATQRRVRKPELIACPTCGRLEIDLEKIIAELETAAGGPDDAGKISVLGCVVNGPGEAREADIGIAAGNGQGRDLPQRRDRPPRRGDRDGGRPDGGGRPLGEREPAPLPKAADAEGIGRRKLPVIGSLTDNRSRSRNRMQRRLNSVSVFAHLCNALCTRR